MIQYNDLGEYLVSLNRCGYCGKIISGEICKDETGEMCEGEIRFAEEFYAQQFHEEEMLEELRERYNQLQWNEYSKQQSRK